MATETKANYSRIGFVVVVALAAAIGTLVYLGGAGGGKAEIEAETYCDTAVSGLSKGSEVTFRGVKVGEVREITFVGHKYFNANDEDSRQVLIVMSLDAGSVVARRDHSPEETVRRCVEHGMRATVTSSGITGISHVELNYPKVPVEARRISWRPDGVCIPPAPSILESFSDAATRLVNQLSDVDVHAAWSNLTEFAADAARMTDAAGAALESQMATFGNIMSEIEQASSSLRQFAEEVRDNPSLLLRPRDPEALPETEPE